MLFFWDSFYHPRVWNLILQISKPQEKLNDTKQQHSNYDSNSIRWCKYLIIAYKDFDIYYNHKALKHINSQKQLNHQHVKWVSYYKNTMYPKAMSQIGSISLLLLLYKELDFINS